MGLRVILAGALLSLYGGLARPGYSLAYFSALVIYFGAAPLAWAGLWYTVRQSQNGTTVRLQDFGQAVARYWSRMLALAFFGAAGWATAALVAASFVMSPAPAMAPVALLVLGSVVTVLITGFAPYLVVSDDLSARRAAARAMGILRWQPREVLGLTWLPLVYILGGEGLGAALGTGLPHLFLAAVLLPLAGLYLAERYRATIGPAMRMVNQGGRFHPDPTTPGL